jgi:hypothetical protein
MVTEEFIALVKADRWKEAAQLLRENMEDMHPEEVKLLLEVFRSVRASPKVQ